MTLYKFPLTLYQISHANALFSEAFIIQPTINFPFYFSFVLETSTYLDSRRESRNLDSNFHLIRVKFPPPFV